MKDDKIKSILRFLIRNYAINSTSSFEDLFENKPKPKVFRQSYNRFKCDYQFYVNRYMALSYIYHSLINIGSLYSSVAFLHENNIFYLNKGQKESNFFIAANEPFGHQVIMQYAKLYEALVDIDALDDNGDIFNEKDKRHAAKLLANSNLINGYSYLSNLRKKIELSGVLQLRNSIFAHPFKDGDAGSVVFLEYVSNKIFAIFRELCDEKDKHKYDKCSNRIRFYCNNYIMSANYDFKGGIKGELRISTRAQSHIKELYDFMSILRSEKLLNEEPLLMVDTSKARIELEEVLAKI
ncbi:hypothetical protein M1Q09_04930 [Klebsiella variicola]|uniref:hypothetical protein n=1 Tax=Klebsiella variicola TaxID=244366 RepID=UPI00236427C1|nr:hypothetical protein [Klebsiella variicola]MDD1949027.1 hypothetical protein [Klebsiella variicola]